MIDRIAILGTGLLGSSVGLAVRAAGSSGSGTRIVGWNRSREGAEAALKLGAIDTIADDPIAAAREAQVILIAAPIYATLDLMEQLAPALTPAHLVTDVGSTKAAIAASAARLYNAPGKPAFLPGHPMAGKERGGAELADAHLFHNAVWIFTDAASAGRSHEASSFIAAWRGLVHAFGARILDLDPVRHDELVAWLSHLPQFTATALGALLEEEVGDAPELKDVGGRGLREMTRLAASPFSMWRDIALTNTEPIERALLKLEQHLAHIRENLRTPQLREVFDRANEFRKE